MLFYVTVQKDGWTLENNSTSCAGLKVFHTYLFRRGNHINITSNTSTIITSPKHSKNHALASHETLCPADQLAQLRILRNYTNQPITSTSQQFMENPLGNCGFSIPEQFTTRKNQRSRVGGFRPQRPSELRTRVAALPSKPPTSSRIRPGRCNLCWEVMTWICFTSPKKEIRQRLPKQWMFHWESKPTKTSSKSQDDGVEVVIVQNQQ